MFLFFLLQIEFGRFVCQPAKICKVVALSEICHLLVIVISYPFSFDLLAFICVIFHSPIVAGWGRLGETNMPKAKILQQIQVPVMTNDECKKKFKDAGYCQFGAEYRFNETYVICAGYTEGGKSPCFGDSGGPMMLPIHENGEFPYYLIGVISYGKGKSFYQIVWNPITIFSSILTIGFPLGCGRKNIPGVYVNVQKYIDWITEKLK